jgi:hypothetical protein
VHDESLNFFPLRQTALLELLLGLVEGNPNADTVLLLASKLDFEKMTSYATSAAVVGI